MKSSAELLPITLVCKHWRYLALGATTLWSSLSYENFAHSLFRPASDSAALISHIPATSIGSVPLYVLVTAPFHYPDSHTTSTFLTEHGHQIEELHVALHINVRDTNDAAQETTYTLPPILTFEAISLRRLVLCGSDRCHDEWQDENLFGGAPLHLSSLAMWNVPFLPLNPMGSSLTRLYIGQSEYKHTSGVPQGAIPVLNLLFFLAENTGLEQAYVEGIAVFEGDSSVLPLVTMPHIRKLSMAPVFGAGQVLSCLDLPEDCLIRVSGEMCAPWQSECLQFAIARLGWEGIKAHVLWMEGWRRGTETISMQVLNRYDGGLRIDFRPPEWSTWTSMSGDIIPQIIHAFLSTYPFVTATELWLSGTKVAALLSKTALTISPLSGLVTLHILNLESLDRQHAGILWPRRSSQTITRRRLPNLTCLHYCLRYTEERLFDLADLLHARRDAGYPVSQLYVSVKPGSDDTFSQVTQFTHKSVDEVIVGESLYNQPGIAWWSVVPRECTAEEEVHECWPAWIEGFPNSYGASHPATSIRVDAAFGGRAIGLGRMAASGHCATVPSPP